MKKERWRRLCGVYGLAVVILAGCGKSGPGRNEAQSAAAPATLVGTTSVTRGHLDRTEDWPGRVVAICVAEIRPQVSGVVQRRLFEQGTEVSAGQPLFQINPAPFKADADTAAATLQHAQAVLARARVQAERFAPLVESDAISRQVYDDAVSQRDQAVADVAQARAALARKQLDLKFATVDAPIAGRIDQALVSEGALVGSGDSSPMARIQQIDQVYVDVRQPAASLESLRRTLAARTHGTGAGQGPGTGIAAGFPVTILRDDGTPYDVSGRILFSGINVDAGTGDVLLRVVVDNPKRQLLPGMFVRARVTLASYAEALTVPQQAVVRMEGMPRVWTVDEKKQAHVGPVALGELVNGRYRIEAGLHAGQTIVVEGMDRLAEGATVDAREQKPAGPASDSDSTLAVSAR